LQQTLYLANFNIWFCPAADWREFTAAIQREMTAKKSRQCYTEISKNCFRQSQSIEWTRKQFSRALDRRNIVMLNAGLSQVKLSIISVALAALAAFVIPARAQDATEPSAPNAGFVDDWTHHHLVFSNPGARDDAVRNGTLDRWSRITNDPRYQLQSAKRTFGTRPVIVDPDPGFGTGSLNRDPRGFRPPINNFGNGV